MSRSLPIACVVVVNLLASLACCCLPAAKGPAGNAAPADNGAAKPFDLANAATDFDGLDRWCEQSAKEIAEVAEANPNRGRELQATHVEKLRKELLGKEVRWKMRVTTIGSKGVNVQAHGQPHERIVLVTNRFGERTEQVVTDIYLNLQILPANQAWVSKVSPQKLREMSVGDFATVAAMVRNVAGGQGGYLINVDGASID